MAGKKSGVKPEELKKKLTELTELAREIREVKMEKPPERPKVQPKPPSSKPPKPPFRPNFRILLPVLVGVAAVGGFFAVWKLNLFGGGGVRTTQVTPNLEVSLSPEGVDTIYAGREWTLTVTVKNRSNKRWTGDVIVVYPENEGYTYKERTSIGPNQSYTFTIYYKPKNSGNKKFVVAGKSVTLPVTNPPPAKYVVTSLVVAPKDVVLDPQEGGQENIEITAEIMNTGGEPLDQDVLLSGGREGYEEVLDYRSLKEEPLKPGERRMIRFTYTLTAEAVAAALGEMEEGGSLVYVFRVGENAETVTVRGSPSFQVRIVKVDNQTYASGPEGELLVGDKVVVTFELTNVGTAGGWHNTRLTIGGADVDNKLYYLKRGETKKDNFIWVPKARGTYEVEVDSQRWEGILDVKKPPQIELVSVTPGPTGPWSGNFKPLTLENFLVKVTLRNTGEVKGGAWVRLTVGWTLGNPPGPQRVEVPAEDIATVEFQVVASSDPGSFPIRTEVLRENDNSRLALDERTLQVVPGFRSFQSGDKWTYTWSAGTRNDEYLGRLAPDWNCSQPQVDVIRGVGEKTLYRYYWLPGDNVLYWLGEKRGDKNIKLRDPLRVLHSRWLDVGGTSYVREIQFVKSANEKIVGGVMNPVSAPKASSVDGEFLVSNGSLTSSPENGYIYAVRFKPPRTWNAVQLGINVYAEVAFGRVAIYADSNGEPGALLCQSGKQAITKPWSDFSIPTTTLNPDNWYWAAFWLNASGNTFYYSSEAGSGRMLYYPGDVDNFTFPSTFPSGATSVNYKWNIRILESVIYPANLSVDKKTDTSWRSLVGQPEAWLVENLGSSRPIDGVRIYWSSDYSLRPPSFTIQVSDNPDGPWENVLTVTQQPIAGWNEYFFSQREKMFIRIWSTGQMGICEVEYYSPLTVNLSADLYSIRFDNIEPFGTCVAFNYTLRIDGYGKVTGTASALMGAVTYTFTDAPTVVHVTRSGTMWYSRRYGLVKDKVDTETWTHDPLSWYMGTYQLNLTDPDTVTLQSATLSD
jgi:hypothetical protein